MNTTGKAAKPSRTAGDSPLQTGAVTEADGSRAAMVVLANRLPFDLEKLPDGSTRARQAPGGLVTALAPILSSREGAWVGWPGTADVSLDPTTTGGLTLHPVTLTAEEVDDYYEGFSNATLWPLYHDAVAEPEFHRQWWECYQRVNQAFADRAAQVAAPGATVWIHDYQLQLVPQLLRELRPDVRIGFFLHIPFPPAELFMRLPWRTQIVNGLLGADLIGFQLPGGARNFVRLARQLTGASGSGGLIEFQDRTVRAGAFPISIDSASQAELAGTPEVIDAAAALRADLGNPRTIILGVDRLDYTKGINVRLRAFGELLAEHDPAVEDAVMVQIATPSRERLGSYIRMREEIERQVGAINGDYGRIGRPAVHYLHQSLPREALAAFYVAADVMTVTPLRDGMNLVAKEYVASRVKGDGVLLLSEFTGAARELRSGIVVNPYDTDGVKDGLRTAITLPKSESRRRMRSMRRQVLTNDVDRWAASFLSALEDTRDPIAAARHRLSSAVLDALAEIACTPRLLVATDFDGTLAPIVEDPGSARALPEAEEALHILATLPDTEAAVVSGRGLDDLKHLLGESAGLHLIGSHGAEARLLGHPDPSGTPLSEDQLALLERLTAELERIRASHPAVRLEHKPIGVAVHFRGVDGTEADAAARAVAMGPANWAGVHLMHGKKVLELTVLEVGKGPALRRLSLDRRCTATIFIGDDVTDEDAFRILDQHDLGVKVGRGESAAKVRVSGPAQVADLLTVLAAMRGGESHRDSLRRAANGN